MKQYSVGVDARDAGVDYIRGTVPYECVEAAGGIDGMWASMLGISRSQGEEHERIAQVRIGAFVGLGWRGYAFASDLNGNVMVQVPGAASEAAIGRFGRWMRPSRIDLQLTGEPLGAVEGLIQGEYEGLVGQAAKWPHRGRAPQPKLVKERATTAYSGRRSRNGVMLRVYNNGFVHENEEPALSSSVRYEVEYTGKQAAHIYARVEAVGFDPLAIARIVAGEARYRGAKAVWYGIDHVRRATRPLRERDGTEATIRWMQRQVVPSLKRLSRTLQNPLAEEAVRSMDTFVRYVDTSRSQRPG